MCAYIFDLNREYGVNLAVWDFCRALHCCPASTPDSSKYPAGQCY